MRRSAFLWLLTLQLLLVVLLGHLVLRNIAALQEAKMWRAPAAVASRAPLPRREEPEPISYYAPEPAPAETLPIDPSWDVDYEPREEDELLPTDVMQDMQEFVDSQTLANRALPVPPPRGPLGADAGPGRMQSPPSTVSAFSSPAAYEPDLAPPPRMSPATAALVDSFAPVSAPAPAPGPAPHDTRAQGLKLFDDERIFNGSLGDEILGFDGGYDGWASPDGSYELLPPELRQLRTM